MSGRGQRGGVGSGDGAGGGGVWQAAETLVRRWHCSVIWARFAGREGRWRGRGGRWRDDRGNLLVGIEMED